MAATYIVEERATFDQWYQEQKDATQAYLKKQAGEIAKKAAEDAAAQKAGGTKAY